MNKGAIRIGLTPRLVDMLYIEAMLLADEARAYFDAHGRADRDSLTPLLRVSFSCESLKVTTRLMHVIAWLLTRRAIETGELHESHAQRESRRLGHAAESDPALVRQLPGDAQALIAASSELYRRVRRVDAGMEAGRAPPPSPAHGLIRRLEAAF